MSGYNRTLDSYGNSFNENFAGAAAVAPPPTRRPAIACERTTAITATLPKSEMETTTMK